MQHSLNTVLRRRVTRHWQAALLLISSQIGAFLSSRRAPLFIHRHPSSKVQTTKPNIAMAFISRFRTKVQSWWQDTPLPAGAPAHFQSWHEFDESSNQWRAVEAAQGTETSALQHNRASLSATNQPYTLVTWNVDYSSPLPGQRLSAILSHTLFLSPAVDIIFFQELSREAFLVLLDDPRARQGWILSDADGILRPGQSFTTITLLSKARFQNLKLGPVWRVKYPSRFERDALCCDVFVPLAPGRPDEAARIRLVNVHLDSLPIQPSLRPHKSPWLLPSYAVQAGGSWRATSTRCCPLMTPLSRKIVS